MAARREFNVVAVVYRGLSAHVWPVDENEYEYEEGRGLCASQNDARSSDFRRRGMNSGGRRESTVLRGVLWAAAARLG